MDIRGLRLLIIFFSLIFISLIVIGFDGHWWWVVGLWLVGLIYFPLCLCYNIKQRHTELSENINALQVSIRNPVQSTESRPSAPIPYLRTISLPTYEMAVGTLGQKKEDQESPPPQFHELHF